MSWKRVHFARKDNYGSCTIISKYRRAHHLDSVIYSYTLQLQYHRRVMENFARRALQGRTPGMPSEHDAKKGHHTRTQWTYDPG